MCAKIKVWSSRNLSYAGRLQLVNSVLLSISSYSCQIFLLPKAIIHKIIGVCRSFLWHGTSSSKKMCPVSWEEVCTPKHEGGLGVRNLLHWNVAAVGKHVWAIARKKDNMWVRWVHSIYIKDQDWNTYKPTQICSWVWKSFCSIKDTLLAAQVDLQLNKYSIKKVYDMLRPTGPTIHWDKVIWNTAAIPKHQFLTWLAFKQRLLTKDSKACMAMIANWVGLQIPQQHLQQLIQRVARNCKGNKLRRQAYNAIISVLVYFIWRARNDKMWNNHGWTVEQVAQEIKFNVKTRLQYVNRVNKSRDNHWFANL
ncbi:hypothetical protein RDABS01_012627 [Bienertia sinuspersici]